MNYKVLHTSDLHLGSPFGYLKNNAKIQQQLLRKTVKNIVEIAKQQGINLILFAGDIFDNPYPQEIDKESFLNAIHDLINQNIYVAIIPGNHDKAELGSFFLSKEITKIRSEYFKVFIDNDFEKWEILELDTTVFGASTKITGVSDLKQLPKLVNSCNSQVKIGLAHGSLNMIKNKNGFLLEDIENCGLDYLALGDWHNQLKVPTKNVTCFYSGSPEVLQYDQEGAGKAIVLEISDNSIIPKSVNIGKRKVINKEFSLQNKFSYKNVLEQLKQTANSEDFVVVKITGYKTLESNFSIQALEEHLFDHFFYVKVVDESAFKISSAELDSYPEKSVIGNFIRILQDKKTKDKKQDSLIDSAIQLGVKKLKEKQNEV